MKQFRFPSLLLIAALFFIFTSCNNGGGSEANPDTSAKSATVDSTPPPPPSVNTIVTTPQSMMIATHKVADFDKWLASYEANDSLRLAHGIHSYVIGRGLMDQNMVMVAVKCDDMAKAKAFAKDASLKKAMQKGGVVGAPTFLFVTTEWMDTATLDSKIRSRTTFEVKDWEAWKTNFLANKQQRLDNGITDRAIGHDVDNNKKVSLVTAILDTAKAFTYYKSDALKKAREAGGVIGEPKRFLYTVVKRY